MIRHLTATGAALLLLAAPAVLGQAVPPKPPAATLAANPPAATLAANPRGVYATIDLRAAQEMITRLSATTGRRAAIREVLKDPSAHMPPVLYALANALAVDDPDGAVFWYHVGRVRAVYDGLRCRDVTARSEVTVLGQTLLSLDLRKILGYERDLIVASAKKAIEWDSKNPRNYDQRWIALYGKVAAASPGTDPAEILLPESEWPAILQKVHETHLKSVQDFAEKKGR